MKILVFLHEMALGGAVVNAIELAELLRDRHGHDVVLFAPAGPMVAQAKAKGLRLIESPAARVHPCPQRMRALRAAVRRERADLVYVWETWALVDAYYAVHLPMAVPMLMTDMQMKINHLLPKSLPSTFGTPELAAAARAGGRRRVDTLLPPIDTRLNAPRAVNVAVSRARFGFQEGDFVLAIVSRLDPSMKLESLGHAIEAIDRLSSLDQLRLLIVGDGAAREELQQRADALNERLGRRAVLLAGAMLDPRPAYAAADIVIGMGSSALKGMAFEKPVIVVGEQGFAAPFTEATLAGFYERGLFGVGQGSPGSDRLVAAIEQFVADVHRRSASAALGLRFVREHFSLERVCDHLNALCAAAVADPPTRRERVFDGLRTAAIYLRDRRFLWRAGAASAKQTSNAPVESRLATPKAAFEESA